MAGLASRAGLLNDSMFSETGGDGRAFWWPVAQDTVLAAHSAIRYLPTSHQRAVLGAEQRRRG